MSPIAGPIGLALNPRWIACSTSPAGVVLHSFATQALDTGDPREDSLRALAVHPSEPYLPIDEARLGERRRERLWRIPESELEQPGDLAQLLKATRNAAQTPVAAPRIMGILNVTPDSFSDGNRYLDPLRALDQGQAMLAAGATILDVGGESTRPGSAPVPADEEWRRVGPVLEKLAATTGAILSIDTTKAEVARRALEAGAHWVNDIRAGTVDPKLLEVVAEHGASYVAMHCTAPPDRMQQGIHFGDVVAEVSHWLRQRLAVFRQVGIRENRILLDPGIGFGKHLEHNLSLLGRLWELRSLGCPLLLGVSRKSFIAHLALAEKPSGGSLPGPADRVGGTAAAVALCVAGGASVLRVHDVATMAQAAQVAYAVHSYHAPRP
ncbi:MAG TPA: dihydropteroate synthase [Planctomycetota bacterium]|nr:dihydropteroate synthase [Planctomycetota bacterium]